MSATPASSDETIYYNEGNVKITNARAILDTRTFAMNGITSVSMSSKAPPIFLPAVLILIGVIVGLMSIGNDGWLGYVIAMVLIGAGVGLYKMASTMYTVRVGSASGEQNAYTTSNQDQIRKIVEAINTAIIKRG